MDKMTETKELLTTRDICELFGITARTVMEWRKNGVLKPIRIGRKSIYYKSEDIRELIGASNKAKENQ